MTQDYLDAAVSEISENPELLQIDEAVRRQHSSNIKWDRDNLKTI